MSPFIHLHTHSHYSLLDGLSQISKLVAQAKKNGMSALALTDHGNLYGAIEFYKKCKKEGIKPIIGVEAYVANRTRHDKEPNIDNKRYHLTLLAKNETGYRNLLKLVTASHLEGYYYKPRMDLELLRAHNEGLICLSGCIGGEVSSALKAGQLDEAERVAKLYRDIFGTENYFLEVMHHPGVEGVTEVRGKLIELGKKLDIPLVATQDSHYLSHDDAEAHEALLAIQTNTDLNDADRFSLAHADLSFIDTGHANEIFSDIPEAVANTQKIADMCDGQLPLGKWAFPVPQIESGRTPDEELRTLAFEGIAKRELEKTDELLTRLEYELGIIKQKGYSSYFIVVADLLRYAHENGIFTNIRGSVAGSLVTYLTGITKVNPIEYLLPFERFLNPERPSAPDIDMDFADDRRDEVIEYVKQKYGADKVAQIGTFGKMLARGVVRDVARALGYPYALGDKISRLIPLGAQGFPMTIDKAFKIEEDLKKLYGTDPDAKRVLDLGRKLEGCARHISVHAAGVVISPTPLTDYTPLQLDPKGGKVITQYDMYSIDEDNAGLLKFDFLGIRNLSILADAVERVRKIRGPEIDIERIPRDDKKTFEMLSKGETGGLFQLSGGGMTKALVELGPTSIHDINLMVALYRPGPMDNINEYIARKKGKKPATYAHPKMKNFLERTYGVLVYQDDLLMTAVEVAGYTWGEVDKFRKAVGKKIPEEMAKQHVIFVNGCMKNSGMTKKQAEDLWNLFEPFQGYGFNKCLVGSTRIMDANTGELRTIEELYKDKKRPIILSMNKDFRLVPQKITAVMQNGIKKVFSVKTRSGRTIRATGNHPLYTFGGWKHVDAISIGERIATPRTLPTSSSSNLKNYEAKVLGYLLSEGNLCHPHGVYFYSTQDDELDDFIGAAQQFPNATTRVDRSKSAASVYVGQLNPRAGNSLYQWLKKLDLIGKRATEKFIPQVVFGVSLDSLAIMLGKLWQGDGAVSLKNQQLFYATSSPLLARDVQHLLLRFGILSTIHDKKFKYRDRLMPGYTVVITRHANIIRFAQTIGKHLIGHKKEDLIMLARFTHLPLVQARGTKDTVPSAILGLIRDTIREKVRTTQEVAESSGIAVRLLSADKAKIGYQRETIAALAEELDSEPLANYAESDIYWDEVVSITPAGREMTYDITVPPYHNFVANDIVVHNSHAASYGLVAYQTAYMKANYPAEYMTAVLTAESGDIDKISEIIVECKRMGFEVLPPDINESESDFTVVRNAEGAVLNIIRFGLRSIKNFGEEIGRAIIAERKARGSFTTLSDFLRRVQHKNLNKKSLEALIMTGAMDSLGERGTLLANTEEILAFNRNMREGNSDQASLFSLVNAAPPEFVIKPSAPATLAQKLKWEKELLGLYISAHPLEPFKEKLTKHDQQIENIKKMSAGTSVLVAGMLDNVKVIFTKTGNKMAFGKITDFSGTIEVVAFSNTYEEMKELFVDDTPLAIRGSVSMRGDEPSVVIERAKLLS